MISVKYNSLIVDYSGHLYKWKIDLISKDLIKL